MDFLPGTLSYKFKEWAGGFLSYKITKKKGFIQQRAENLPGIRYSEPTTL